MTMARHPIENVTLADRFTREEGRVVLTGIQGLVRLLLDQRRLDRLRGLDTAGFVSGYRGSPLGGFDSQLAHNAALLNAEDIVFRPAVNEDLGATAVWGSQQVGLFPGARVGGVFGLWYGKSPGVDRSGDALRHANFAGTSPLGGVLCVAGDDPAAKSSSLPNQSDHLLVHTEMPILVPATITELIRFGLMGYALSRFAGLWVGFKVTTDLMDSSATVDLGATRPAITLPDDADPRWAGPRHIRANATPAEMEARHRHLRLPALHGFVALNHFDRVAIDTSQARLVLVTAGNSYWQTRQALDLLGIDDDRARSLGLRLVKLGLVWPLDMAGLTPLLDGTEEVLVIEEKRPLIEEQLRGGLYALPDRRRPRIVGKHDPAGRPLLSDLLQLDIAEIAIAITDRLHAMGLGQDIAPPARVQARRRAPVQPVHERAPYFCAGCPHNRSTLVPDGSRALAGIGCHYMAMSMDRASGVTQMGGEGVTWVGQAPFTDEPHVFVNLGDGTYFHSGLLAIRQAVAAGTAMTYRILYNDAVAMTGGQQVDGILTVPMLVDQLRAEGVRRIAVVQEEPRAYRIEPAKGVTVSPRADYDIIQDELRAFPGVSVIVYDQVCATEKRRRRKRGTLPKATWGAYINPRICEDCGDCTVKSNCVAVQPLDTQWGRKRAIDQSACNADLSCVEGFCPSFITFAGVDPRRTSQPPPVPAALPQPVMADLDRRGFGLVITGIGGMGVTSLAAIIGMAARLDGREFAGLDITGLAQKGGGVCSFIRIAPRGVEINGPRLPDGSADLLLAADMVVATGPVTMPLLDPARTAVVLNDEVIPTAEFMKHMDIRYRSDLMHARLARNSRSFDTLPALALAERLMGDRLYANMLMLGFAWQKGLLPLSELSLLRAIKLNDTAVETNQAAFAWGRLLAADPDGVKRLLPAQAPSAPDLGAMIARHINDLVRYQDRAYADRYATLIDRVRCAETAIAPDSTRLTEAVALNFHRLMAYKDEYEVARLWSDGEFIRDFREHFTGNPRFRVHLAPPLFARRDPATGLPRKQAFGPWIFTAFRLLAGFKRLRGSILDPFGHTVERRTERRLRDDYERRITTLFYRLDAGSLDAAVAIAEWPSMVRGFGHVKDRNLAAAEAALPALLTRFEQAGSSTAAAA